jgi:DNA replication protein DnaC
MSITTANTTAPALPADLEALMRQLKMPHARAIAPDVLATARAQRWEPTEVIKAPLAEETKGRARSMLATRRKAAGFPTGKTFALWDEAASSIPAPTQQALRTLEWIHRKENLVVCGPSGTGKTFFLEALGQQAVEEGMRVALVHPRGPRRPHPLAPGRRHRHPGRGQDPARRSGRH